MNWNNPKEIQPTPMQKILIDCVEGTGDGYYKGNGIYHFNWSDTDLQQKYVFGWALMRMDSIT